METRALKFQGSNHSWEVWKRRWEDQESEGGLGLVSPVMHTWCEPQSCPLVGPFEIQWVKPLAAACTALKWEPLLRPSSALLHSRTPWF